jgi:hypothetical protein
MLAVALSPAAAPRHLFSMLTTLRTLVATAALALAATSLHAQGPALRIERDGRAPVSLTGDTLRRMHADTVSLSSHGAPAVRYRAVNLIDIMAAAGSPIDSLRLGHAGWIVVGIASDGYVAVFSAGELDPKLGPSRVWVAFERDGTPLEANEAPFHLIIPTDLHGSRSARQVVTLRILDALPQRPAR